MALIAVLGLPVTITLAVLAHQNGVRPELLACVRLALGFQSTASELKFPPRSSSTESSRLSCCGDAQLVLAMTRILLFTSISASRSIPHSSKPSHPMGNPSEIGDHISRRAPLYHFRHHPRLFPILLHSKAQRPDAISHWAHHEHLLGRADPPHGWHLLPTYHRSHVLLKTASDVNHNLFVVL